MSRLIKKVANPAKIAGCQQHMHTEPCDGFNFVLGRMAGLGSSWVPARSNLVTGGSSLEMLARLPVGGALASPLELDQSRP